MALSPPLQLYRIQNDPHAISAVARTISLSFSQDPLIRWLRPSALPWGLDQLKIQKWQERRVKRAVIDGIVFQSASTIQLSQSFPPKTLPTELPMINANLETESAAAIMLFPPAERVRWTVGTSFMALTLLLADIISPVQDRGTDQRRLEMLLNAHSDTMKKIKIQRNLSDVWYLEVVAVHPSFQSRGLGRRVMEWVLNYIEHGAIVLECTSERNIKFYEGFGFQVVDELMLEDKNDAVKCWVMLREAQDKE